MKKIIEKVVALLSLSVVAISCMCACGGDSNSNGKEVTLDFLYSGTVGNLANFKTVIDQYNAGQGKTDGIKVRGMPVSSAQLTGNLSTKLYSPTGPDVAMLDDQCFKTHAKALTDLTGLFSDELLSDLYPTHASRYYYDVNNMTSKTTDPLLGLPLNNDTTVLYYNKDALEALNIKCISVEEDELAAFNAGGKDHNGKTKSDYGIPSDVTVQAKGFFREKPYEYGEIWSNYSSNELMIFNDRIPMSWDEIEDVATMNTKSRNGASQTQYGYYTEWWFNYAWSIGGDCMEDLTGNGDYVFSHACDLPNYLVVDGSYTGLHTGNKYSEGETLDFKDIISANPSDTINYSTDSRSYFYFTVNGQEGKVIDSVESAVATGTLAELPSTKAAVSRFCEISSEGEVMPYPRMMNGVSTINFFTNKQVAFCIEYTSNFSQIAKDAKFKWSIAPLPIYKEYVDVKGDEVKVEGACANHSLGYCVSIRKGTRLQDASVKFMNWLMVEGQAILAEHNVLTSKMSLENVALEKFEYDNDYAYLLSLKTSYAGDWWYMPDRSWIDNWAKPLNNSVREGKMDLNDYFYNYIEVTNQSLKNYKTKK